MDSEYHVPDNRSPSPYRWRIIIRIMLALVVAYFPLFIILRLQAVDYWDVMRLGGTFLGYVAVIPSFWAFFPLSIALVWLLIGIGRDGWLLVKRRGTPTLLPLPYWLALLFAAIAFVLYVRTIRIP